MVFTRMKNELRYEYMAPSEILARLEEKAILYWPIGSLEWHNEHLPTGTDTFHAVELAMRLCAEIGGVVLPPFWWNTGGCHDHAVTYHMAEDAYRPVLKTIVHGMRSLPANLLVLVNGHGGRYQRESTGILVNWLNQEPFRMRLVDGTPYIVAAKSERMIDHADTNETSLAMELIPDLVRMDRSIGPDLFSGKPPFEVKGPPDRNYGQEFWQVYHDEAVRLIRNEYELAGAGRE